ncbi:MAG: HNH endonuclease, partial [Pseudobdellovibrionaceae bacterium]
EKLESLRKQEQKRKAQPLRSQTAAKTRSISKLTIRELKIRDQHQCQYLDPETKKQCEAQFYLQAEHIVPFAKGGTHELKNLELLCPAHNRLRAVQQFGIRKMKNYLPELGP